MTRPADRQTRLSIEAETHVLCDQGCAYSLAACQSHGNTKKEAILMAQTKREKDFGTALMLLLLVARKSVVHA
jgi:hypothetical protein